MTAVTSPVPVGTSVATPRASAAQISGATTAAPAYEFFTTIDGTGTHTDEVVNLNPDGSVPDSALHGPLAAGVYSFIAVYSGDSNYIGSTSPVEPLDDQVGNVGRRSRRSRTSTTVATSVTAVFCCVPLGTSIHDYSRKRSACQVSALPATGTCHMQFFTTIDGTGNALLDQVVPLKPDGTRFPDSSPARATRGRRLQRHRRLQRRAATTRAQPASNRCWSTMTSTSATVIVDANHYADHSAGPAGYHGSGRHGDGGQRLRRLHSTGTITHQFPRPSDGTGAAPPWRWSPSTWTRQSCFPELDPAAGRSRPASYSFITVYSGDSNYGGLNQPRWSH